MSEWWTAFKAGSETLALHWSEAARPPEGPVTLSLVADKPLEQLGRELEGVGIEAGEITAQPFGRSFNITDPDGLVIQVNEHA